MSGFEGLLSNGEGPLQEQLSLGVPALNTVGPGQVIQALGNIGVLGPEGLFTDGQGSLQERLGFVVPPLNMRVHFD
jgi:hypothetical protein